MCFDPDNRDAILNYGGIFKELHRIEDAMNIYEIYLKRNPDDKDISAVLGLLKQSQSI